MSDADRITEARAAAKLLTDLYELRDAVRREIRALREKGAEQLSRDEIADRLERWVYHGEVVIDEDPQAQAIRTHSKALVAVRMLSLSDIERSRHAPSNPIWGLVWGGLIGTLLAVAVLVYATWFV